jgi:hypothetical protein
MKRIVTIATLFLGSLVGTILVANSLHTSAVAQDSTQNPLLISQVTDITELCSDAPNVSARFECLFEQSNRLNQAKNFARQRAERENGGVTLIEAEPSMHGPSFASPHVIEIDGQLTQYTFTFRLRPRATTDYTIESQVIAIYDQQTEDWDVDLGYNRAIAATSCSYAAESQGECS